MDRGLLVPHKHMPDAILLDERVVERKHRAAGIAEQRIDPELGQLLEQEGGTRHFRRARDQRLLRNHRHHANARCSTVSTPGIWRIRAARVSAAFAGRSAKPMTMP